MDKDWGVVRIDNFEPLTTPPTKRCLICDKLENPNAHMVHETGWICPECKDKLKKILSPPQTNYDHLTHMGMKKLAEWLALRHTACCVTEGVECKYENTTCDVCWFEWLKQEANNDEF